VVAEESSSQMLNGVQSALSESRFTVRFFHADIESSDYFVANLILAGYVDASQKTDVVNGKAWYGFHCLIKFLMVMIRGTLW
jgi:hypothetical protein